MSKIQAILFDNSYYTPYTARKWLRTHEYRPIKRVHKTKKYLRYRIIQPNNRYQYRIINLSNHINAVLMFKSNKGRHSRPYKR